MSLKHCLCVVSITFATPTVPEPHALSLVAAALTGLLLLHRRHAL